MQKITPMYSKILIKPRFEKSTTDSGIFLSGKENQRQQIADVVDVGAGYLLDNGTLRKLSVESSDVIIYEKFAGVPINFDFEKYLIIDEKDVLAKIQ